MGLRLSVRRSAWDAHVASVAALPGIVPVVKGNGYGFGRPVLMPIAARLIAPSANIAVGTVYEAHDVPADRSPWVLTPHLARLPADLPAHSVLTVGSIAHVAALCDRATAEQGWGGRVMIKLASSMRRYGTTPADLPALSAAVADAGLTAQGYAIHLPLAGTDTARRAEIIAWLYHLDPYLPVSVSHLGADTYAGIRAEHPEFAWTIRVGTALWHGDKGFLSLTADVLDVHPVDIGAPVGYRATAAPGTGHVALIAAGSAHGVRALDDGRSPFHFARHRLTLVEGPHMHTSMVFIPSGAPLPAVGDMVDVQRPLITVIADEVNWIDD